MNVFPSICSKVLLATGVTFFSMYASATEPNNKQVSPVLTEDQIEARYDAAKERCDALEGDRQDICEQEAETERDKARADAEFQAEAAEAHRDAVKTKNEADWKLAKERCDAMSGSAADACMADARAKHNR